MPLSFGEKWIVGISIGLVCAAVIVTIVLLMRKDPVETCHMDKLDECSESALIELVDECKVAIAVATVVENDTRSCASKPANPPKPKAPLKSAPSHGPKPHRKSTPSHRHPTRPSGKWWPQSWPTRWSAASTDAKHVELARPPRYTRAQLEERKVGRTHRK
jgi:hypothetical protein